MIYLDLAMQGVDDQGDFEEGKGMPLCMNG